MTSNHFFPLFKLSLKNVTFNIYKLFENYLKLKLFLEITYISWNLLHSSLFLFGIHFKHVLFKFTPTDYSLDSDYYDGSSISYEYDSVPPIGN